MKICDNREVQNSLIKISVSANQTSGDLLHPLPNQRWFIYPSQSEKAQKLAEEMGLSPLLAQVLINREIETREEAQIFLDPDSQKLPSPIIDFPDLAYSLELLEKTINQGEKIAICGDYDADGMTSTALLWRCFSALGAQVSYAIPSRMKEGYGINERIVEEFHQEGISVILTVDNGIAAHKPIDLARQLGLKVIITDHHDLPPTLPNAQAILNPKLISESSPYRGLAGVGVAYILAVSLAEKMGKCDDLNDSLLVLFTLGTIADLAPLTGVNRRWVKRGLRLISSCKLAGVRALTHVSGVKKAGDSPENYQFSVEDIEKSINPEDKSLKPDDIGFRLGPRINAVGRLDDPQIVIELLTTDEMEIALERSLQCENINQERQLLCTKIEQEAILWCTSNQFNWEQERVLVIIRPGWHHGVIGIVASRLVDRYGVPVFIGTYEEENEEEVGRDSEVNLREKKGLKIRGSARGIPEFNVYQALLSCDDLLGKYGGHKAAGGFSILSENLPQFQERLRAFAHQHLKIEDLKPLVIIDSQLEFHQINFDLYEQINRLHPCGIENKEPFFWTPNVRVVDQAIFSKNHLKFTCIQENNQLKLQAIAWRWGEYFPLPNYVDIAYKLKENCWKNNRTIQLELVGLRLPLRFSSAVFSQNMSSNSSKKVDFYYQDHLYSCVLARRGDFPELRIRNQKGQVLAIQLDPTQLEPQKGLLGMNRETAKIIDISEPFFSNLIQKAKEVLELRH